MQKQRAKRRPETYEEENAIKSMLPSKRSIIKDYDDTAITKRKKRDFESDTYAQIQPNPILEKSLYNSHTQHQVSDPRLKKETKVTRKELLIPLNLAGSIIGRQGSVIKNISRISDCKIQIQRSDEIDPNATERLLSISGSASGVQIAEGMIATKLIEAQTNDNKERSSPSEGNEKELSNSVGTKLLLLPNEVCGRVIGRGGHVIKDIIAKTGCDIQFQHKEDMRPDATHREVTLRGLDSQIDSAAKLIRAQIQNSKMSIGNEKSVSNAIKSKLLMLPNEVCGLVIGRGGHVIKDIIAKTGCDIQFQHKEDMRPDATHREVTLRGLDSQIDIAINHISSIQQRFIENQSNDLLSLKNSKQEDVSRTIMVPTNAIGKIIGKGGNTIKQLRKESRCNIQIQKREDMASDAHERCVTVFGNVNDSKMAISMIMDKINGFNTNSQDVEASVSHGRIISDSRLRQHSSSISQPTLQSGNLVQFPSRTAIPSYYKHSPQNQSHLAYNSMNLPQHPQIVFTHYNHPHVPPPFMSQQPTVYNGQPIYPSQQRTHNYRQHQPNSNHSKSYHPPSHAKHF